MIKSPDTWRPVGYGSARGRDTNPEIMLGRHSAEVDTQTRALPTLRAATARDTSTGVYYAPEKMFNLKGYPVPVEFPKPALDTEAARRL